MAKACLTATSSPFSTVTWHTGFLKGIAWKGKGQSPLLPGTCDQPGNQGDLSHETVVMKYHRASE